MGEGDRSISKQGEKFSQVIFYHKIILCLDVSAVVGEYLRITHC